MAFSLRKTRVNAERLELRFAERHETRLCTIRETSPSHPKVMLRFPTALLVDWIWRGNLAIPS